MEEQGFCILSVEAIHTQLILVWAFLAGGKVQREVSDASPGTPESTEMVMNDKDGMYWRVKKQALESHRPGIQGRPLTVIWGIY